MIRRLLALLVVPTLLTLACVPDAQDPRVVDHVLSRIAYGPDAWTRARATELGLRGFVEEQLQPETIDDSALDATLAPYETLGLTVGQLHDYVNGAGTGSPRDEAKEAKVLRAVYSRRQLEQVLTDFWFDHFNVDAGDGVASWTLPDYERSAIRAHVLGRFEDMLLATARHPAMLDYLDNAYSMQDWPQPDGTIKKGINENYGREVLELHTMGVDGGYTQEDVVAVARAFTGWMIDWKFETDGFSYQNWAHDWKPKTILGTLQLPQENGEADGRAVIQFLAQHPMTAERVSRLLVERFIDENAPLPVVMNATQKYLETGGDLREVMRVILLSPEFLSLTHARTKAKRPLVLVASLMRATQPSLASVRDRAVDDVEKLGEILFEAKPPTGYPDRSAYWAGPGAVLTRFDVAQSWVANAASRGIVWGIADGTPDLLVQTLSWQLLAGRIGETSLRASVDLVKSLPTNTTMAKKIDQAAGMVLSTPEFLLH